MKFDSISLAVMTMLLTGSSLIASPVQTSVKSLLLSANLTELVSALETNKLNDILNSSGPLTIFAPTNEAFKAMLENKADMVKKLNANSTMYKNFLYYHVVARKLLPNNITNEMVIDSLLPRKQLRFNIYGKYNKQIKTINGVMFMEPVLNTSNVVVYNLNNFLLSTVGGDIVNLLKIHKNDHNDHFSILLRAIQVANLTTSLERGGPFTVFSPTDDAFNHLPRNVLDNLMASPAEMKQLLMGHIVSGTYFLSGLTSGEILSTLNGKFIRIHIKTALTVHGANMNVEADMLATNGVIHVIDQVLMS